MLRSNGRDWQQLIKMFRAVDTVLVDQEMVCAPRHADDRLLELKGNINEHELDLLRQRSLARASLTRYLLRHFALGPTSCAKVRRPV